MMDAQSLLHEILDAYEGTDGSPGSDGYDIPPEMSEAIHKALAFRKKENPHGSISSTAGAGGGHEGSGPGVRDPRQEGVPEVPEYSGEGAPREEEAEASHEEEVSPPFEVVINQHARIHSITIHDRHSDGRSYIHVIDNKEKN